MNNNQRKRKIIACLTAAVMTASTLFSTGLSIKSNAVDDNNDDWLHAVGSRLYDEQGNEVWLTGANWFGMNCTENVPHGLYATDIDDFLGTVSDHGINLLRLPISTELLLSWMDGKPLAVKSIQASNTEYTKINPDFCEADGTTVKNSMEIFDIMMQKCKKYGIKVMVDVHSPAAHNSGHNYNLWYYNANAADADNMAVGAYSGKQITWDDWKDSITWLAKKYNNDDTIIGYDLKNEPHGKRGYNGTTCPDDIAKWDDSTDQNNWRYSATECADSILNVNPHALIFVEGVEQYPKTEKGYNYNTADIWQASADVSPWYGAWWGGNLRGVKDYPVTPKSGTSQIVYSPHDYGPSVYAQTWFNKNFTEQTLLDDYWYDTWAYINDKDIAPLLIGEWGGHMDAGTVDSYGNDGPNQKWMTLLRDYMIKHHINHTFWCLNPNSGDTGGLLSYDFKTWDEDKYNLLEPALWQTSKTGKYISLDHVNPLGKNGTGISVSDYYANYDKKEGSNLDSDGSKKPDVTTVNTTTTNHNTTTTTNSVTTVTSTQTEKPSDVIKGDFNNDKKVNVIDLAILKNYISKKSDGSYAVIYDYNEDKKIDSSDIEKLQEFILKK